MKFLIVLTLILLHTVHATEDPCFEKPDPGLCKGAITRYFFNFTTNSCDSFTWGGCGGVVPFESGAECRAAQCGVTRCDQTPDPGPCRASVTSYFYNSTSEQCEPFVYGGCRGTVPFRTMGRCRAQCMSDPCQQTPRSGPCREGLERYFYNTTTMRCESFRYGGCRGLVPFDTRSQCRRSCRDPCSKRPDPGPCRALFVRYFYNSETMACESFTWGGCSGSVPFETLTDCQNAQCNPLDASPEVMVAGDNPRDIFANVPGPQITR